MAANSCVLICTSSETATAIPASKPPLTLLLGSSVPLTPFLCALLGKSIIDFNLEGTSHVAAQPHTSSIVSNAEADPTPFLN